MPTPPPLSLKPRKKPRQTRATVTLEAIFEATVQLLLSDGSHRLTTTRVAERAGVSVGTMYQYFPHKQALIYALNERYLEALAGRIEVVCEAQHGAAVGEMVEALIDVYWRAKTERAEVTRALYRSVAEMDNEALINAFAARTDAATITMLSSAAGSHFTDLKSVHRTLVTVIFGSVRNAFERGLSGAAVDELQRHLVIMCHSYLQTVDMHRPYP